MRKYALIALIAILAAIQLVRPQKTNPPVDQSRTVEARTQITPDVKAIMDRSCTDCHSNKTAWPWYSQIAPVSWLLVHDVSEGRRELNLSDWQRFDTRRAGNKLDKICEEVRGGDMPLWYYTPLHRGTKLSDAERKAICDWTEAERARLTLAKQ